MTRKTMFAVLLLGSLAAIAGDQVEINTLLMHNTFKIEGTAHEAGKVTFGTVFLIVPPPDRKLTLVTAAHVFDEISGENARLHLRKKVAEGIYEKVIIDLPIRQKDSPLWTRHPDVDVAVMRVVLPTYAVGIVSSIGEELLATDDLVTKWTIHPGDELLCLGFPYGAEANAMGFPILRSGKIASFPIVPAASIKSFLYDFQVFGGNSGGPVYFVDRSRHYGGEIHIAETVNCIMGLVSQEQFGVDRKVTPLEVTRLKTRFEVEETRQSLGLAIVIPSHFIKETISILIKAEAETKQANKASEHSVAPAPQVQH